MLLYDQVLWLNISDVGMKLLGYSIIQLSASNQRPGH